MSKTDNELRDAINRLRRERDAHQMDEPEYVDRVMQLITDRDAEREAAIRMDEGKYWENNIMPEFRSNQTSEKMSNRYKALEAIKQKAKT